MHCRWKSFGHFCGYREERRQRWKGPLDHVLAHVVVLGQVEKLADLGGTLGSQTTRDGGIGEAGNVVVSFLHNNHRNDGKISIDNASTNRLAFTFTCTALTVARVAFAQEKTHTKSGKDTLFHRETLLVVSTSNTENVTGPFVTKGGSINFLAHTFLIKGTNLDFIVDFKELLATSSRKGHVNLHVVSNYSVFFMKSKRKRKFL